MYKMYILLKHMNYVIHQSHLSLLSILPTHFIYDFKADDNR